MLFYPSKTNFLRGSAYSNKNHLNTKHVLKKSGFQHKLINQLNVALLITPFTYLYNTLQKQTKVTISRVTEIENSMDLNSSNSDVSYNDSDQSQQIYRAPQFNQPQEYMEEVTADSFREALNNQAQDETYHDASKVFSMYYKNNLVRTKMREDRFQDSQLFTSYKKFMTPYHPRPNLYFLPTILLLDRKMERVIELRDSIVSTYKQRANVQIPKQRPQQILVTIHNENQMSNYIIRSTNLSKKYPHQVPELLDQELSLNPLFEFYEENYKNIRLSQTCGIFLYWGYQRKLLNADFLTPSAMKIIIIFSYIITGHVPNIIPSFMQNKAVELNKLTKLSKVNKKLECELDQQLFQYHNFSLRQKKSFYIQSQRKYSIMIEILPVPYPIEKKDVEYYSKKCQQHLNHRRNSEEVYPLVRFFRIMEFLANSIKRTQRVIFDFLSNKKGIDVKPEMDFNIQIKHPIFGNNLCEKITNDSSKLRILKQEINRVVQIFKSDKNEPLNAIAKIFQK